MTATVKLWAIQPGPMDKAELVERAARLCYRSEMSETREAQTAFLKSLFKKAHTSIAEHARYVFTSGHHNPHEHYWRVRYGVNITERGIETGGWGAYYVVSWNARNMFDFAGRDVYTIDSRDPMSYDELTSAEKLAHASATFEIGGISRACSHQLVRHRVMSFSQESQRYCDSGAWEPVVPPTIMEHPDDEVRRTFHRFIVNAKWDYRDLRDSHIPKIPKQDARFLLPNATPTRLMVTATFEHWRHFLKLRLDKTAQWEIRGVAQQIHAALAVVEPGLFGDLTE